MYLTHDEAEQVYEFFRYQYLDPNRWPALSLLLDRIYCELRIQDLLMNAMKGSHGATSTTEAGQSR